MASNFGGTILWPRQGRGYEGRSNKPRQVPRKGPEQGRDSSMPHARPHALAVGGCWLGCAWLLGMTQGWLAGHRHPAATPASSAQSDPWPACYSQPKLVPTLTPARTPKPCQRLAVLRWYVAGCCCLPALSWWHTPLEHQSGVAQPWQAPPEQGCSQPWFMPKPRPCCSGGACWPLLLLADPTLASHSPAVPAGSGPGLAGTR